MTLIPPFIRNGLAHRPDLLKIIHSISWLSLDKVLRMGVGLLISALIARHLAPAQYGVLNYAPELTGLTGTLATLGLHEIVVRDIVRSPQQANIAPGSAAVLQIFSGLLSFLLTLACTFQLPPNDVLAQMIVAILGSTMLIKANEIPMYWFEAQVQSKYAVSVQNGVFLVFAATKAFVILNCGTIIGLAWATLREALSVASTLIVVMNRHGPALNSLRASTRRAKILLQDSWPLVLAIFAVAIYMRIDQIMLGQMASDEAVGIFSVAVRISEIWYFMPIAIVASVFPSILEAKSLDEATYQYRLQKLHDLMVQYQ